MAQSLFAYIGALASNSSLQIRFLGHDISVFSALVAILVASRFFKFMNGLTAVNHLPGMRVPFQPLALPGVLIPTSWWNPGIRFPWEWRLTCVWEQLTNQLI